MNNRNIKEKEGRRERNKETGEWIEGRATKGRGRREENEQR